MQKAKANSSKRHRFVRHKNLADCVGTKEHLTLTSTRWQEVYSWTHGGGPWNVRPLGFLYTNALHFIRRTVVKLVYRTGNINCRWATNFKKTAQKCLSPSVFWFHGVTMNRVGKVHTYQARIRHHGEGAF